MGPPVRRQHRTPRLLRALLRHLRRARHRPPERQPLASPRKPSISKPTWFGIDIGTVEKQNGLRPLWRDFLTHHAALVAGLQVRQMLAPDEKWRLIAGPFSSLAEATQACGPFKKANLKREATAFAGFSLATE